MAAKRLQKKNAQAKSEVPTTPEQAQVLFEKLQASETRYRRLFETAQDGILLLDADTGQITDVNPFMVDMLGYPREHFLGRELWEIGPVKDEAASRQAFVQLREKRYVRYEDLPLETFDGRRVQVAVSYTHLRAHET